MISSTIWEEERRKNKTVEAFNSDAGRTSAIELDLARRLVAFRYAATYEVL
jgi:hypothetical protein